MELGFGHGASSCIIAAALEEVGHGHLTAVDLESAREWQLIFQLLVMQHPDYANFHIKDNWWAWAQKTRAGRREPTFEHSPAYRRRLAEWEARTGRRHRAPFEPFQK